MALTIRQVDPARVTADEREAIAEVFAAAFGTYAPHVLLFGADAELDRLIMRTAVDHSLARHEVVVAERGGGVVGAALGAPGRHVHHAVSFAVNTAADGSDEQDAVYAPIVARLPERAPFLLDLVGTRQPGYIKAQVGDATKQWWLLAQLGVSPAARGTGVGSALLQAKRAQTHTPLYLNTQTAANVAFYEKNGFALRADKVFDVPWSTDKFHDRFMISPGDA